MTAGHSIDVYCGNDDAIERFHKIYLFWRSRDRHKLNLCPEYITLFDSNLRMRDYNGACLNAMVNPAAPRREMLDRSILDYFPDLERLGAYEQFLRVHSEGGSYTVKEYQLNGYNLDTRIRCSLTVFKIDGVTVVMGEDITVKADVERKCYSNIQSIVMPLLSLLKSTQLNAYQRKVVNLLDEGISRIADDFSRSLQELDRDMTPREIEIANLIRTGKTTKDIAQLLHLANKTVDFHRASLRRKMGIANKTGSLRSCLLHAGEVKHLY